MDEKQLSYLETMQPPLRSMLGLAEIFGQGDQTIRSAEDLRNFTKLMELGAVTICPINFG